MAKIRWTKQFWAARRSGDWKLTAKIANPLEAMKQAWGEGIMQDVVFIIGLQPTPIERGGERFDSTYEIVDLGRNQRRAYKALEQLQEGAKAEKKLHAIIAKNADELLREHLTSRKEHLTGMRKRLGDDFARGGFGRSARHGMDDLARSELEATTAATILAKVECDLEEIAKRATPVLGDRIRSEAEDPAVLGRILTRKATQAAMTGLAEALMDADIGTDYNAWGSLYQLEMYKARSPVYKALKEHLNDCDEHDKALAEIDRRIRLRRKPIDQQLGLEQPKIEVTEVLVTDSPITS